MVIKNHNGSNIIDVVYNGTPILRQELMKEHYITLPFTIASPTLFRIGSYVDTDFGRFIIKDTYKPTRNNTNAGYDYQLRLDAWYYLFANKVVKFMPENDASETTFELTANISTHVQTVMKTVSYLGTLSSLYKYNGTTAISTSIDSDLSSEAKYIKYDSVNVIDAFTQIAEAFDCEWWFVDNVLFFGKCERGTAVTFTHLSNVIMTSSGNKQPFANRIIAFGSERNLPHNYRGSESIVNGIVQKRLMLPVSTCPNGYIQTDDVTSESEVVEIVRVYDYVYPKVDCEVSQVTTYTSTVENEDGTTTTVTFYRVKDGSGFDFSTDLILEGETLHIIFQSGLLNGMDFECHYNDQEKYYEVIVNENYGIQLPNETLHPAIGDKFILTGWDATQMASTGIIEDAEEELYNEASKDLAKLRIDPNNYNCDYLADENHTVFPLGQKVELVNPAYFTTTRLSRIIGYEIKLDIPYDHPMYIVGESVAYNRLGTLERMIQQLGVNGALLNEYNTRNWQSIVNYTNLVVGEKLNDIQNQLDHVQVTYFGDYAPALNNEPASTWASSEYSEHDGDMFYNRTSGKGYEFTYKNGAWGWVEIQDEDIRQALEEAAAAQDTADGKRRVFVTPAGTLPTPPYDENDLWVNATYPTNSTSTDESQHKYYNDILKCITPRAEGATASINDWSLGSKYTDDSSLNAFLNGYTGTLTGIRQDITNAATAASNAQTSANNASSAAAQAKAAADALDYLKQAYLADNTLIDHGLILSTIVALRDSSNNVWSGISGAYDSTKLGNGIAAWYGGGMIDKEVSAVSNAAKSLFRFDGSGYVASGNLKWDANGNVTIQGYSINATTLQVGGANVATESSISTFFANFFDIYNGSTQITYAQYVALQDKSNVSLKAKHGLWTEQFLSALGMNSQGGGGGGTGSVNSIKIATNTYLDPDEDGIIDMSSYATTWNNKQNTITDLAAIRSNASNGNTAYGYFTNGVANNAARLSNTTKIGDTNQPVYFSASGVPVAISYTIGKSVPTNAVFTDTTYKLTLNGTTNGASGGTSLGSFYAPTASGTANQVLISGGANTAPSWTAQSNLSAGDSVKLNGQAASYYATASSVTTIQGYFTSGAANNVVTTADTTNTLYVVGVTSSATTTLKRDTSITINGNALSAGSITTTGNVSIGGTLGVTGATTLSSTLSVASGITLTTTKKIYFGDTSHYIELTSTGFHFSHGIYSDSFVSALGANSSGGGGGGVDLDAMWASLMNTVTDTYASSKIATAHIPNLAASIITSGTFADARIPSLAASKITSGTFDTARIPNLSADKITSGTFAAARIPVATASAVGGIKVGTTLAISDGVLNQKSGIATAGTYRSVTVDTYGRVTAGTNPTTLSGYGITNAYTKTQVDTALSGYLPLSGGTLTGGLEVGGTLYTNGFAHMIKFDVDTSRALGYGWWDTNSNTVASIVYHNTAQNIILNPIGSASTYSDAVGKYSLIVGNNSLTYNTYPILHSNNYTSYTVTKTGTGASGTWGISVTGNAATATTLATSRYIWGQSFNGSANISGSLSGVGSITATYYTLSDTAADPYLKLIHTYNSTNYNYYIQAYTGLLYLGAGYVNSMAINSTGQVFLTGHLFLNGAQAASSTGNTTQIIFRASNTQQVAISSNSSSLIINPTSSTTTNQIVLGVGSKASTFGNSITCGGEVTAQSDGRKKNIISNTKFNVKDIASARSVLFEWNDGRDDDMEKKIHGGSIAQDWIGKADSFLSQDNDGWYSINYGALALCSAITIAREVVKHEDEITRLKKEVVKLRERVAELEERRA